MKTSELRQWLEAELSQYFGRPRTITHLGRRAFAYSTSFAQEELEVVLDDETRLRLIFKDVGRHALRENARLAKPLFLYEPLREIVVYRAILGPYAVGGPICYGAATDRERKRFWLALQYVPGWTLFEVEEELWPLASQWLSTMHARFSGDRLNDLPIEANLLFYDRDFYLQWASRVGKFMKWGALADEERVGLQRVLGHYDRVADHLSSLPPTFLHGEFVASNVVVETLDRGYRICPVDWEMAGVGPGLIDLAALTSGQWNASQRETLARAYWESSPHESRGSFDQLLTDLRYCHLHVALQWLGWARGWTPPPEHATNWLHEALRAAAEIGL